VLQQCQVPDRTNEFKAALDLLKTLCVSGRVVVGDAMFCQREFCQQVLDSGGDYLVAVKENQPNLLREIQQEFAAANTARPFLNHKTGPLGTTAT
jgi:predicted transposase YbfD/YdcC